MIKYERNCPECNKLITYKSSNSFYQARKKNSNCHLCSYKKNLGKHNFKGKNNPFYGKKHSKETKERMSKNHADFNGDKNPFKKSLENTDNRLKASNKQKEYWKNLSKEKRKVHLENLSKSIAFSKKLQSTNLHKKHKSCHLITKKAGKIFCRSSWESKVALWLDSIEEVILFRIESLILPYTDNLGNTKNTRIDFYVKLNNKNLIIEIKPKGLQTINNNDLKIKKMSDFCKEKKWDFFIVDEDLILDFEKFKERLLC